MAMNPNDSTNPYSPPTSDVSASTIDQGKRPGLVWVISLVLLLFGLLSLFGVLVLAFSPSEERQFSTLYLGLMTAHSILNLVLAVSLFMLWRATWPLFVLDSIVSTLEVVGGLEPESLTLQIVFLVLTYMITWYVWRLRTKGILRS